MAQLSLVFRSSRLLHPLLDRTFARELKEKFVFSWGEAVCEIESSLLQPTRVQKQPMSVSFCLENCYLAKWSHVHLVSEQFTTKPTECPNMYLFLWRCMNLLYVFIYLLNYFLCIIFRLFSHLYGRVISMYLCIIIACVIVQQVKYNIVLH